MSTFFKKYFLVSIISIVYLVILVGAVFLFKLICSETLALILGFIIGILITYLFVKIIQKLK